MKTSKNLLLLFVILVLGLSSCNKDEDIDDPNINSYNINTVTDSEWDTICGTLDKNILSSHYSYTVILDEDIYIMNNDLGLIVIDESGYQTLKWWDNYFGKRLFVYNDSVYLYDDDINSYLIFKNRQMVKELKAYVSDEYSPHAIANNNWFQLIDYGYIPTVGNGRNADEIIKYTEQSGELVETETFSFNPPNITVNGVSTNSAINNVLSDNNFLYLIPGSSTENTDTYFGTNGRDWSVFTYEGVLRRYNNNLYVIDYYANKLSKVTNGVINSTITYPNDFTPEFIFGEIICGFVRTGTALWQREVCISMDFGVNWYQIENSPIIGNTNPYTLDNEYIRCVVSNTNYIFVETDVNLYCIPLNFISTD